MKVRSMKMLLAAFALALTATTTVATAQEVKIGYVNSERVGREADPAKRAKARLEAEFGKREKALNEQHSKIGADAEKLDRDAPTLSESEKVRRQRDLVEADRDFQRKQREYQEDLTQRRNEEMMGVGERMNRAIKQIVDTEKYDLILVDQAVQFASARVDITKKVIDAMNAAK